MREDGEILVEQKYVKKEHRESENIVDITDGVIGNIYEVFGFVPKLKSGDNLFGSGLSSKEDVIGALMSNDIYHGSPEGYSRISDKIEIEDLYKGLMKMVRFILAQHYKREQIPTEVLHIVNYNYLNLRNTENGEEMIIKILLKREGLLTDILIIGPDNNLLGKISQGKTKK